MAALLPRRDWFRALRGPGRRTDRRQPTSRPVALEALDTRTLLSGVGNYVESLYSVFLHRNADPGGLASWVQQFPTLGPSNVANDIARSPEALQDDVTEIYQKFLHRAPDPAGLAYWTQEMEYTTTTETVMTRNGPPLTIVVKGPGLTIEQVEANFLASAEFQADANAMVGTTNAGYNYVEALYTVVLGRPADAGGLAAWLGALPSLGSYQVADDFVTGPEYQADKVGQFYQDFLGRAARRPKSLAG